MRKIFALFIGFFTFCIFSLGAFGFYICTSTPAPTVAGIVLEHSTGAAGCVHPAFAIVNDMDVSNPHNARDAISVQGIMC